MVRALVNDLLKCPDVEVLLTRDERLPALDAAVRTYWVRAGEPLANAWRACMAEADAVWPIAPETDGILEGLCHAVQGAGRLLLNSRPEAVAMATSKFATLAQLKAHGVPTVPTWWIDQPPPVPGTQWVVKPDRGAGCRDTRLITDPAELFRLGSAHSGPDWVVQSYLPGRAASLSLLVGDTGSCVLGCNLQRVVLIDDRFTLLGCVVNGLDWPEVLGAMLGRQVVAALPGLWGYLGVDFILTEAGPVVLEVNPRLTTSYVGLSRSIGRNVAGMVLDQLDPACPSPVGWLGGQCVDVDLGLQHGA